MDLEKFLKFHVVGTLFVFVRELKKILNLTLLIYRLVSNIISEKILNPMLHSFTRYIKEWSCFFPKHTKDYMWAFPPSLSSLCIFELLKRQLLFFSFDSMNFSSIFWIIFRELFDFSSYKKLFRMVQQLLFEVAFYNGVYAVGYHTFWLSYFIFVYIWAVQQKF